MFFFIGIILTVIMLQLLPDASFRGNRKKTTLFLLLYSLIYFYILQYCQTLSIHSLFVATFLMLYLACTHIYINKTLGLTKVFQITLFVMGPIGISLLYPIANNQFHVIDIFIIAWVIAMNQLRLIKAPLLYQENLIEFYGLSITFHLLILYVFLGYRKIDIDVFAIGTMNTWGLTLGVSLLCCIFAALIGLKFKYLSFSIKNIALRNLTILSIFNFFHVAIAEEIIFRGLVYNYLQQFIKGGEWISLILTTLLFGCHHISFGGKKMFILSSIAGFFYGLIYVLTKNILAAAFIHAVTNIIWRSFFVIESDLSSCGRSSDLAVDK